MNEQRAKAVAKWIESNFVPGSILIEPFEAFPCGRRIIDSRGDEMVVYFDLITDTVKFIFPEKRIDMTYNKNLSAAADV